ncbi:Uncharacterised protein [Burkholderia pseudomallei]|nr:Uncharacterised protein [Burkholderia pseudomallei]
MRPFAEAARASGWGMRCRCRARPVARGPAAATSRESRRWPRDRGARAPGRSARFSRPSPFAILGFSTGRAPPASFIRFHAPSLLLEPPRNAGRRVARRSRLRVGRRGPLGRAAGDRAERGAAPAARARPREAPRRVRERALQLSRAMAVGADRRSADGARAFAVRARSPGVALLPAAVGPRRRAVARIAAACRLSGRGRRADAPRACAPDRDGVRPLSDVSSGVARAMAGRRIDLRARRRAAPRRRGRARRRGVAGRALARAARGAVRQRHAARAPVPARGPRLRSRCDRARAGEVAGCGQRVRAADDAAAAHRAVARAVALDRRAHLRAQSVPRILVRHRHGRARGVARRGGPARLSGSRPSAARRMGQADASATAHAARADRERGGERCVALRGQSRADVARARAERDPRSAAGGRARRAARRARRRSARVPQPRAAARGAA